MMLGSVSKLQEDLYRISERLSDMWWGRTLTLKSLFCGIMRQSGPHEVHGAFSD